MVDLDWHRRIVADNRAEQFARIKCIRVDVLKPFQPRN